MKIHSEYLALKKLRSMKDIVPTVWAFKLWAIFFSCQEHAPQPSHMVYVIFV